jgi:magnesium transporter
MARFLKKREKQMGKAPGSLIYIGEEREDPLSIEVIEFDENTIETRQIQDIEELRSVRSSKLTSWVNIIGVHNPEWVSQIGEIFELHLLTQEDVLNTGQRPKCEEYDCHIFLVLKMIQSDETDYRISSEQLSLIVGENYLLTFQERKGDVFDCIRDRLLRPTTKIRTRKSDYLAYALMDAIVDQYIYVIEQFGERIEGLEKSLLASPGPMHKEIIYKNKREINFLRKTVRPVRDLVVGYKNAEASFLEDQTLAYVADLEDHITHASEAIETYQVMLNDQLNLFQLSVENRLNEILKVLTIFSVVFIPLTFIAGIYGTNFKYLPELEYRYAYPIFWGVLIGIAVLMLYYFKRKKWL